MTDSLEQLTLAIKLYDKIFPNGAAVAQLTVNQLVGGSNPSQGANFLKGFLWLEKEVDRDQLT